MPVKPRLITNEDKGKRDIHDKVTSYVGPFIIGFILFCSVPLFVGAIMGVIPALVSVAVIIWFTFYLLKKWNDPYPLSMVEPYDRAAKNVASALETSLDKVDYYNTYFFGGIAVDTDSKKIIIVNLDALKTNTIKKSVFGIEEVKSYKHHLADFSLLELNHRIRRVGSGYGNNSELKSLEVKERFGLKRETGITFYFDNIETPQVFIAVNQECIEDWMMVIEKLRNGTLGPQSEPTFIPYGKSPDDYH